MLRRFLVVAAVAAAFLLPVQIRAVHAARSGLLQARVLRAAGRVDDAIAEYAQAASWRSPFNFYARAAAGELRQYSGELSAPQEKLSALRRLRSALYGSRSFLPDPAAVELQAAVEQEIAVLNGNQTPAIWEVHPPRLSYRWQLLAQLFFWSWLAAMLWLIARGFDRSGAFLERRARLPGGLALLSYAAWLFCLRRA